MYIMLVLTTNSIPMLADILKWESGYKVNSLAFKKKKSCMYHKKALDVHLLATFLFIIFPTYIHTYCPYEVMARKRKTKKKKHFAIEGDSCSTPLMWLTE